MVNTGEARNMLAVYVCILLVSTLKTDCMTLRNNINDSSILLRRIRRQDVQANLTIKGESPKSLLNRDRTDVIFPGPFTSKIRLKIPSLEGPPSCADGETFCENIETYPQQAMDEVLRRSYVDPQFFGADETRVEISNRNGGADEMEQFICSSNERTIFPKVGKTKSNKWRYIINQEDSKKYIQGVRIETCSRPDEPCDLLEAVPLGYVTSCKQKFVYRRLLTLQNNEPAKDYFEMPSACCCSYKRDMSFLSTFGNPVSPPRRKKS